MQVIDKGFAGGLNSTFTSMGNFVGPLVAGSLFDVNIEFLYYCNVIWGSNYFHREKLKLNHVADVIK